MSPHVTSLLLALVVTAAAFATSPLVAQVHPQPSPPLRETRDTTMQRDSSMQMPQGHTMTATWPLGIPMAREGSGTSWLPDSSPMYAAHRTAGAWQLMLHGNVFVQYISEQGDRGDNQFGSVNWLMGMAHRPLAGGMLMLRTMMSAEPSTVGRCGYPDLLASGELCFGQRLRDRQHPHDLFMELAASYERALSSGVAFQLYGGPAGEPAIGPGAYPHRLSAMPNPMAPISHHWLDATHISFGVITAGLYGRQWKVEGSAFNGREPDERRYDLDLDALDSYSGRLWFLPDEHWALQVSTAQLTEAEQEPGGGPRHDARRTTASATYHRPLSDGDIWATTAAWGRNASDEEPATDAFLVETNLDLAARNVVSARAELVRKTGGDLALDELTPALSDRVFTVGTMALGYTRTFGPFGSLVPGLGGRASINVVPESLEPFYGSRTPVGFTVFLNLRPSRMMEGGMSGMPMRHGSGQSRGVR